jgi:hypothetical protein
MGAGRFVVPPGGSVIRKAVGEKTESSLKSLS